LRRSWLTPALPYEVHGANATSANIGAGALEMQIPEPPDGSGGLRTFPSYLYADLCLASASAYSRRA
jgi:hypothetical protein